MFDLESAVDARASSSHQCIQSSKSFINFKHCLAKLPEQLMLRARSIRPASPLRIFSRPLISLQHLRFLLVLAIETSCDDTSVAILETHNGPSDTTRSSPSRAATLYFHKKVTSDNRKHGGIHPVVALESHEANLGGLVNDALQHLPLSSNDHRNTGRALAISRGSEVQWKVKPDFVSVTRGPGMRSNLAAGLGTAKGLSIAWQVPLVGVHHMQAHALTPRLVTALQSPPEALRAPNFPFLSLLVSGGHTMLLSSRSLTEHTTIASTLDVAIGDSLDKAARMILPADWITGSSNTMYGRLLEQFAFPHGEKDYNYRPLSRAEELVPYSLLSYKMMLPLATTRALKFSFAGIPSTVERVLDISLPQEITHEERVKLARTVLRVSFEHLASRIVIALEDQESLRAAKTLVISGGVASNDYLKAVIRSVLDLRGYSHLNIVFPPPSLCIDNAAMIAWTGVEMFEAGWTTDLSCSAIRKWDMDLASDDGGILGATGWLQKWHGI